MLCGYCRQKPGHHLDGCPDEGTSGWQRRLDAFERGRDNAFAGKSPTSNDSSYRLGYESPTTVPSTP